MSMQPKRTPQYPQISQKTQYQRSNQMSNSNQYQQNIRFIRLQRNEKKQQNSLKTKEIKSLRPFQTPFKHLQQFIEQDSFDTGQSNQQFAFNKNQKKLVHSHSLKRVEKPKVFNFRNSENNSLDERRESDITANFRQKESDNLSQADSQNLAEYYGLNKEKRKLAYSNNNNKVQDNVLVKRIEFLQRTNSQLASQNILIRRKMQQKEQFHQSEISLMKNKIKSLQSKLEQLHRMFLSTNSSSFQINISNDINANYYS